MQRTPTRLIVLGLVFLAGLTVALVPLTRRAHADNVCTPDSSWGTVNSGYASQVVSLVNQHRASLGLGQLSVDGALSRAAVWKSMNMSGLNYFDHTDDPIGRSVGQRLVDCGYPANQGWGENIAYGYATPDSVMTGWLNSPGHKANIENPAFTSIGVGVAANAQGAYYWTQDFGQGSSGSSPPPPPPTTTSAPPAPTTTTTPPPPPTTTTTRAVTTTTTSTSTTPSATTPAATTPAVAPPTTTTEPTKTITVPVLRKPAARKPAAKKHKPIASKKRHAAKKRKEQSSLRRSGRLALDEPHHL